MSHYAFSIPSLGPIWWSFPPRSSLHRVFYLFRYRFELAVRSLLFFCRHRFFPELFFTLSLLTSLLSHFRHSPLPPPWPLSHSPPRLSCFVVLFWVLFSIRSSSLFPPQVFLFFSFFSPSTTPSVLTKSFVSPFRQTGPAFVCQRCFLD